MLIWKPISFHAAGNQTQAQQLSRHCPVTCNKCHLEQRTMIVQHCCVIFRNVIGASFVFMQVLNKKMRFDVTDLHKEHMTWNPWSPIFVFCKRKAISVCVAVFFLKFKTKTVLIWVWIWILPLKFKILVNAFCFVLCKDQVWNPTSHQCSIAIRSKSLSSWKLVFWDDLGHLHCWAITLVWWPFPKDWSDLWWSCVSGLSDENAHPGCCPEFSSFCLLLVQFALCVMCCLCDPFGRGTLNVLPSPWSELPELFFKFYPNVHFLLCQPSEQQGMESPTQLVTLASIWMLWKVWKDC